MIAVSIFRKLDTEGLVRYTVSQSFQSAHPNPPLSFLELWLSFGPLALWPSVSYAQGLSRALCLSHLRLEERLALEIVGA